MSETATRFDVDCMLGNIHRVDAASFPDGQDYLSDRRRAVWVFILNLLSFAALCIVTFRLNEARLFVGLDGSYMSVLAKQRVLWTKPGLGFSSNVFQGVGNIWFPFDSALIPGYLLSSFLNSGKLDPALSYVIFSVELFVSTYLLGLCLRLGPTVAAVAAWGLLLSVMPFFDFVLVYPVLALVPHLGTFIASTVLILILAWQIGRRGWLVSGACVIGATLLLTHAAVAQPIIVVLMAPVLVLFWVCDLTTAGNRRELFAKLGGGCFLAVAIGVSGVATFLLGILKYTAAVFFADELFNGRMTVGFASILFHHQWNFNGGPIVFTLGLLGAVFVTLRGSSLGRACGIGTLAAMVLVITVGLVFTLYDLWKGPSPLYFEFFLWPFYAVYGAVAVVMTWVIGIKSLRRVTGRRAICSPVGRHGNAVHMSDLVIAVLPWILVLLTKTDSPAQKPLYLYPPSETPIVAALKDEIGITPGKVFRGRVATFTGLTIDRPVNWLDLHSLDFRLIERFGNDHRMVGLWYYDIPTLAEYSPLITPPFYLITRTFLGRPGDWQMRNVMTLRQIEPRILRVMGVRFLITDAPITVGAKLRLQLSGGGNAELFLYELDGSNVGNFSPTKALISGDARGTLMAMSQPGFDPARTMVVQTPMPEQLVPLESSELLVQPGWLQISVRSGGTSVLLLPVEYSRCLELKLTRGMGVAPQLFRADLLLTGVLFKERLEAPLPFFNGPLHNATCRLEDFRDMQRLNIGAEAVSRRRITGS